jgi:hypothetical protein
MLNERRGKTSLSDRKMKEIASLLFREEAEREAFTKQFGHARPPEGTVVDGRVWTIHDGGVYCQTQEGLYTFLNVIHDHALHFFGIDYIEKEERKPPEQRNTAIQWMESYVDHVEELKRQEGESEEYDPVGVSAAWYRFAYDLFTIRDNAKLQKLVKERLLRNGDFQSARYELWVAAICITAGFDLDFENERDISDRHPEFIATDRFSSAKIAVEAKSRHRRGVQGYTGGAYVKPGEKVDIRGIVSEAYKKARSEKARNFPLYIFVDVNLPPVENIELWQRWMEEIEVTMSHLSEEGYAEPCPANIVFFSNDPSHYLGTGLIGNESDKLWIKYFGANFPRVPHPDTDICERIMRAWEQRVSPPENFLESN